MDARGEIILIIEQAPHKWMVIGKNKPVMSFRSWSEADREAKATWENAVFKTVDSSSEVHLDDCTRQNVKTIFNDIFGGS